ncbi:hypothetical protein EK21DRAFT_112119 [Setomelanomma holmii]|uniref:DUF6594 domain-containing protein n=1 Tax=Setomelanomma holmii TaxID=210430 RepID=A0A9P4H9L2_9PLEO|nr:hypothetical protein EK21DRAFT_112119 [Setomelanomma holmii]
MTLCITSVLASLLPIASILVLVNLELLKATLWTIAVFNVAISACLNIFADAKRAEVFAVTAAHACNACKKVKIVDPNKAEEVAAAYLDAPTGETGWYHDYGTCFKHRNNKTSVDLRISSTLDV